MSLEILAKPVVNATAGVAGGHQPRAVPVRSDNTRLAGTVTRATAATGLRNDRARMLPQDHSRLVHRATDITTDCPLPRISLSVIAGILRGLDTAVAASAGIAASLLPVASASPAGLPAHIAASAFGAILVVNILHLLGTYRPDVIRQFHLPVFHLLLAWGAAGLVIVGVILLDSGGLDLNGLDLEKAWLATWLGSGLASSLLIRVACALLMIRWRRQGRLQRRIAILGSGPIGQRLLRRINAQADQNTLVVGVYDDRLARLPERCMGHKVLGPVADLIAHVRQGRIDMVVVALPLSAERRMAEITAQLRQAAVDICLCPDQYGFQLAVENTEHVAGVPLLCVERRPLRDWRGIAKDIEDRILAALIFLLISPILLTIAALIKLDSPGPVFFRQKRYGFNNQLIEVLKFRTMHHHASDPKAEQLTRRNDPRVTRLGAFLRRTSLDELPQFINVLRGEMSVVGPRPHALAAKAGGLLYQEAVRYYDSRHRMKPGITGWAQVNGWRGETETVEQIEKRVEYDLYYIRHWSIRLDLLIIFRTIFGGFTGRQAY